MEGWLIGCIVLDIGVILGNIGEQVMICNKWNSLDRIDHLLMSLSISDLINGVVTLGVDSWYLNKQQTINATLTVTESHKIISRVFDTVFIFSVVASVLHVIVIAMERLWAIKFPRKYYIFTKFSFKCSTISTIWIVAVLLASFYDLWFRSLDSEVGKLVLGSVLVFIASIVFLVDMAIAYLLLRLQKSISKDFSPGYTVKQERLKRVTVLFLFMGISFVVCILPISIGYFDKDLYHYISSVMITLNSLINPCIYFIKVYYDSRNIIRSRSNTTQVLLTNRTCSFSVGNGNDEDELCTEKGFNITCDHE